MDNAYRTDEHIVVRRHQGAEMALFFNRFGTDVFVDTPRAERRKDFYVSAYSIRSASKGALLNNTQMIGFYYSGETMFVPYYVTKDDLEIYANVEQRNFNMQQVMCGRKPFVVYTGANSLIEIAETVMTERCRNSNSRHSRSRTKRKAGTVGNDKISAGVHFERCAPAFLRYMIKFDD